MRRSPEIPSDFINQKLLEGLFADDKIRVHRGRLFSIDPPPYPGGVDWDRIEGMMLGLAVGDALGITTESKLPEERRARYGEVRDYLPNRRTGERRGFPSDDTQLAFWTLEQMLRDGGMDPEKLGDRFASDRIFGLGSAVREFLRNHHDGLPWAQCAPESAGNGALMRIAPVLIPHLREPSPALWVDTALAAMVTHNDHASIAACLAWVRMLWCLLGMNAPPPSGWWLRAYVETASDLEGESAYRPRSWNCEGYQGPIWRFVEQEVSRAEESGEAILDACNRWFSGAFLMETIPSVLLILMRHAGDPEEAIVRAVNDTKDNDTVAAIVGSAVGALHGRRALPRRWIDDLTGRTMADDDGRVFELLDEARGTFEPRGKERP